LLANGLPLDGLPESTPGTEPPSPGALASDEVPSTAVAAATSQKAEPAARAPERLRSTRRAPVAANPAPREFRASLVLEPRARSRTELAAKPNLDEDDAQDLLSSRARREAFARDGVGREGTGRVGALPRGPGAVYAGANESPILD
jgi:hypothetical protein